MADEAVLRIVLDDKSKGTGGPSTGGGGTGANTGASSGGGANSGGSLDPVAEAQKRFEADKRRAAIDAEYAKLAPPPVDAPFDPAEVARKRLEKDRERAAIDAEYAKLVPPPVDTPFDPAEAAKKRLEADERRAAIDAEYAKLVPPPSNPPFDPVAEAQKRLEKDKQRAEIDAEYAKLKPTPPFDPSEEARKRRESERRRAQIDAAYKEEYGDDEKETGIDQVLKVADSLRGTLGGVFGSAVGAVLDVVSGVRKAQVTAAKEQRDKDLLAEAQETTKAVKSATKPAPPATETKAAAEDTTPLANSAGAANIANKFKVPKAGFGTATGANSTTQAADIAKLGTNVGGKAGAEEAASGAASGGAMEGLVAAAGPIALAVVAADAIQKAVISAVKGAVSTVGDAVAAIASPNADPSVPIGQMGDAASKAGEKLGILGIGAVIAGEGMKSLSSVMQALDATAQRYAEYSAPISQALAIAEVRQTLGDLRRAQEISPEMVRYIQAQSDLQQKFEDIKIRLLSKVMPIVTRMLEILEVIMTGGENIVKGIELLASPLTKMLKILADWFGWAQDNDREEVEDPTTILFDPRFESGGLGTPRSPGFVPDV